MASLTELIRRVHAAPGGPRVAACFDYDGTVISGYSAGAFLRHRLRTLDMGPLELARLLAVSALGADHVICTAVEVEDGRLTGRYLGTPVWGAAKARAFLALAAEHDLGVDESFAYSNGAEDLPLLEAVGRPAVVAPEDALAAEARQRGWPELRCHSTGGRPGPVDVARTAAMYGGMASAAGVGIGLSLARRS